MSAAPATGGLAGLPASARTVAAFAVAVGTFMQVLDTTVANVSIPVIAGDLGVSNDQGTWVITSFAVANGISVPLTGWLVQRFGLVRTYVAAILLFTLASFLCGIAWSLPSLVGFRVLQGAAAGPMVPGSQALLLQIFPPEKRVRALAIWSITTLVAPVVGPVLGGWLSDNYSWPWIFLINVPAGCAAAFVCWRSLGARDTPTRRLPIDGIGMGLLVVWVGALQILLDKGKDADWFASPAMVVLGLVALVGFVAFLIWELTEAHPIVDLRLFNLRNFRIGASVNALGYVLFFGNLVLFPLWLQTQFGYTATWAGLVAVPGGLLAVALSPLVGRFLGQVDARWFTTVSLVAFAVSFFLRAGLTTSAPVGSIVLALTVQGLALATFFISTIAIMLNGIAPERIPAASSVANFLRITAGSFGASMVTTFWDDHAAFHQSRLVEHTSLYDRAFSTALGGLESMGLTTSQAAGVLARVTSVEAYAKSAIDFFWMSGWLALLLVLLVWRARSTRGGGGRPPVHAAAD